MKKYMKPAIEVARIENECSIMAASNLQTSGLPQDGIPGFDGENDGSATVGSRKYYSIWDE